MTENDTKSLEEILQYRFRRPDLLDQALSHKTWVNEHPEENVSDNQRLEFLGDAVLGLVVGDLLMKRYPEFQEGELTRMRAGLVNEKKLADVAESCRLNRYIRLGKGEMQTGGMDKPSILADTLEAVVAAVYLDGGFDASYRLVERLFSHRIKRIPEDAKVDAKSDFQEIIQAKYGILPTYTLTGESGPDHDKTFQVRLSFGKHRIDGFGKSIKKAEQDAAQKAILWMRRDPKSGQCAKL